MVRELVNMSDGDSRLITVVNDAIRLTIIPGAGATVTLSKVDDDASAHDAATSDDYTSEISLDIDWPFYWISVAGGTARFAQV